MSKTTTKRSNRRPTDAEIFEAVQEAFHDGVMRSLALFAAGRLSLEVIPEGEATRDRYAVKVGSEGGAQGEHIAIHYFDQRFRPTGGVVYSAEAGGWESYLIDPDECDHEAAAVLQ